MKKLEVKDKKELEEEKYESKRSRMIVKNGKVRGKIILCKMIKLKKLKIIKIKEKNESTWVNLTNLPFSILDQDIKKESQKKNLTKKLMLNKKKIE